MAATKKAGSVKKTAVKKTAASKKSVTTQTMTEQNSTGSVKSDVAKYADFEPYQSKKGEEYMGDAQHKHFREILLAWKRGLMEEVDRTVHHMKDEVTNFPDPNDRATQEEEFSLELRTRDRERKLIKKIDESLEQIDNDEYGYCEACGVEIGVRRLEARPTATMCIDCKTLEEIREKQTRI
jgi:DnaK suppressor protein